MVEGFSIATHLGYNRETRPPLARRSVQARNVLTHALAWLHSGLFFFVIRGRSHRFARALSLFFVLASNVFSGQL